MPGQMFLLSDNCQLVHCPADLDGVGHTMRSEHKVTQMSLLLFVLLVCEEESKCLIQMPI